ncbi:uncharacterized protein LOC134294375 [Anolis carolinensis]|uniref:uncharacterized protein LOC134294375 n=1 Tax=Anolis carolinensis TaxID=28377 RepID=UPI002F2B42D4
MHLSIQYLQTEPDQNQRPTYLATSAAPAHCFSSGSSFPACACVTSPLPLPIPASAASRFPVARVTSPPAPPIAASACRGGFLCSDRTAGAIFDPVLSPRADIRPRLLGFPISTSSPCRLREATCGKGVRVNQARFANMCLVAQSRGQEGGFRLLPDTNAACFRRSGLLRLARFPLDLPDALPQAWAHLRRESKQLGQLVFCGLSSSVPASRCTAM